MSIAQTPYPDPTSFVIALAAEPMNRAFAQSGQTSRPVIVSSNGSRTLRPQSGQSRPDTIWHPPMGTTGPRLLVLVDLAPCVGHELSRTDVALAAKAGYALICSIS